MCVCVWGGYVISEQLKFQVLALLNPHMIHSSIPKCVNFVFVYTSVK